MREQDTYSLGSQTHGNLEAGPLLAWGWLRTGVIPAYRTQPSVERKSWDHSVPCGPWRLLKGSSAVPGLGVQEQGGWAGRSWGLPRRILASLSALTGAKGRHCSPLWGVHGHQLAREASQSPAKSNMHKQTPPLAEATAASPLVPPFPALPARQTVHHERADHGPSLPPHTRSGAGVDCV